MTTDITELAQSLKAAAEKATPGRIGDRIDGSGSIKYECHGYDGSLVLRTDHKNMEYGFIGDNSLADEEFFRACVPDAIIALVEVLEKAQQVDEELCKLLPLGAEYMDPPDGGDVTPLEGVRRMVADYRQRIAELESCTVKLPKPYAYLRENDGQIQISIGAERPSDRSGGYATPWFAIYTAAGIKVEAE
ncbi:ead/Ea22-like family protein [Klebsiella pneumoniae]